MSRKFKVGDTVLARSLKSPLYSTAEVTGTHGDEYSVRFSTGEVQKLASRFVLTAERRRGRSASKSPSRDMPKSPARKPKKSETPSKSPARTPKTPKESSKAETKKPAKKEAETKKPAKKEAAPKKPAEQRKRSLSRGRPKKESKKETRRSKSRSSSETKTPPKKEKKSTKKAKASPDPDIDLLVQKKVDEKLELLESPKPEEFSQTESEPEEVEFVVAAAPPKSKTVVDAKVTTVVERTGVFKRSSARLAAKAGALDDAAKIILMAEPRPVTTKREQIYGGNIGVLLLIPVLAALVFWVNIACQKASCAFREKPRFPNNWAVTFLSYDYLLAYVGFCVAQMVFSVLPVGKKLKSGESTFRNNAWLAVILTGAIIGGLTYYKYPVLSKEKDIYTLMAASFIHMLLASTFAYVLGRQATASTINPRGNAGRLLYDWFVGRELNPMYKWFNFKLLAMRTTYIGWAVIVGSILWRAHMGADKLSWTMAFTGGSQLLYIGLQLLKEKTLGTSAVGKSEGVGYAFLWTYSCYLPFIPLLIVRYVRSFKIQQSMTFLGAAAAVYVLGLILSLAGKWLKSKYGRKGASATQGSLMSRISGKMKSSWFGFLRNGSHFGELLMVLGMSLPCGFQAVYPWTYMATASVATVYRLCAENRGR